MNLSKLNSLSSLEAKKLFLECCHSQRWAELMVALRPFKNKQSILYWAKQTWDLSQESDILDAFSGHAKIGDLSRGESAKANAATLKEQGQVAQANASIRDQLTQLNEQYANKFGFIFIVCATGKSAEQMLATLQDRFNNNRQQELQNGAVEQGKITQLRINNLVEESQ